MSRPVTRCANCGRLVIRGELCICTNGGTPSRAVPVVAESVRGTDNTKGASE